LKPLCSDAGRFIFKRLISSSLIFAIELTPLSLVPGLPAEQRQASPTTKVDSDGTICATHWVRSSPTTKSILH
jgi:hypothetical protein